MYRLPVHLPGQQVYNFRQNDTAEQRLTRRESPTSKLLMFFEWNRHLPPDCGYPGKGVGSTVKLARRQWGACTTAVQSRVRGFTSGYCSQYA